MFGGGGGALRLEPVHLGPAVLEPHLQAERPIRTLHLHTSGVEQRTCTSRLLIPSRIPRDSRRSNEGLSVRSKRLVSASSCTGVIRFRFGLS